MNPAKTPRQLGSDKSIEKDIKALKLTAPRVTPADIEANIEAEYFFTAMDGVVVAAALQNPPPEHMKSLEVLTFCVLVLKNGFTVVGKSAPASPENFDPEIGRRIACQNARQEIWPLMGYELKERLHRKAVALAKGSTPLRGGE